MSHVCCFPDRAQSFIICVLLAGVDHGREPCPYRILGDIGGAFGMGAVGGGIWHLVKGTKNSPSGARLRGGLEVSCYLCILHFHAAESLS